MFIRVQSDDFELNQVKEYFQQYSLQHGAQIGAIVSFIGLVREFQQQRDDKEQVKALTLEHYPGMTESILEQIAQQAKDRWQLNDLIIIHRIGTLLPNDNIVLIATASAHRQDAFDACQYIMDILKTSAPFWKKEQTNQGARWVEARSNDQDAAHNWTKSDPLDD